MHFLKQALASRRETFLYFLVRGSVFQCLHLIDWRLGYLADVFLHLQRMMHRLSRRPTSFQDVTFDLDDKRVLLFVTFRELETFIQL